MKRIEFLKRLKKLNKPYYTVSDLQMILGQDRAVTRKEIHRFAKSGILKRIGRNVYVTPLFSYDIEEAAANLHTPCYLSFESALSKYGVLSQIPYTITFATLRRPKKITLGNQEIEYRKLKHEFFFGYKRLENLLIAEPEKALLDELYFVSRGKAKIDIDELDLAEIDVEKLKTYSKRFPAYVRPLITQICSLKR